MPRCILIVFLLCLLMYPETVPWCQTEQQPEDSANRVTRQPSDERASSRSQSTQPQTRPHSQEIDQQQSSESAVTRPQEVRVETTRQEEDIKEVFERPSVELIDERIPYGGDPTMASPKHGKGTPTDIERAWHHYRKGEYEEAARIFSTLVKSSDKKQALNARLGLAYTRLKQGKKEKARVHFQQLVGQKYRLSEILPAYMELLLEHGDYKKAQSYVAQLPLKSRSYWQRRILEAKMTAGFNSLTETADSKELSNFILRNETALSKCISPHLFFEISQRFHGVGEDTRSAAINKQLLTCKLPEELRYGIVSLLADTTPDIEALALVKKEKRNYASSLPAYSKKLDQLEVLVLRRRLDSLPPSSIKRVETAKTILAYSPEDPDALSVIAWDKFNRGDYSDAAEIFSRLLRIQPDSKAYVLGLGYCRLNSGEYDTALLPLEESNIPDDKETLALKKSVYEHQADKAYDAENWEQAADYLEKVLLIDPDDVDAKQLLAWTRFHQGHYAKARTLLEQTYTDRKTPQTAGWLMDIYAETNSEKAAYDLARNLSQDSESEMRAVGADFYFNHNMPITASQALNNPEQCYFNAFSPRFETFLYHKNKSGDSGFSKLNETGLPITGVYPTKFGKQWSLSVTPKHLSSGNAPDEPFAGRFFKFVNGTPQLNKLEDSLWVWQPDIGFEKEGRISVAMHVGSTPFNGEVNPTPTFQLQLSGSKWNIDLHRSNVKESILSYTGLEDPYSSNEWGRVTRNGIDADYRWSVLTDYWLSVGLGYNHYDGHHVWDNDSYHLNTAVGRTLFPNKDELSYGIFFTAEHFRRNSDFYTYGHGGYYSPDLMTMVGPFFRYRSALCRDFWVDFQAAVGWLHQEQDDSPFYPLFNGNVTGLSPAAAANALGDYDSDSSNELGYSFKFQGMKLLNRHVAAGGFAAFEKNTEYTEWQVGAGVQYFFNLQNLFWKRKDFFNEFGNHSNK